MTPEQIASECIDEILQQCTRYVARILLDVELPLKDRRELVGLLTDAYVAGATDAANSIKLNLQEKIDGRVPKSSG